jgi:hypothetical protein
MRDVALEAAGMLAILVAVIHGSLSELRVFPNARIEPRHTRRLLRLLWQATTVDWIAIGVLLIAVPSLGSPLDRQWVVALAVIVYTYAAVANAVATRARHPGWVLMGCVVALAIVGL